METQNQNNDIYGIGKRIDEVTARIFKLNVSENSKQDVLAFRDWLYTDGCRGHRVHIHLSKLYNLMRLSETSFHDWTANDFKTLYARIMQPNVKWSNEGRNMHIVSLRKLAKFKFGDEILNRDLKVLKIHRSPTDAHRLTKDLITSEDYRKLLDACENSRDRALIAVLYEGGLRIGEAASMKIKSLDFQKEGVYATVTGKTGQRTPLLLNAVNYLATWLENHPNRTDRESYLWVSLTNERGKALRYDAISRLFKRTAKRAGVKKRLYPHLFRHSAASRLASIMTEHELSTYFGWVIGSDMARNYVHGLDANKKLLQHYGLVDREQEKDNSLKCPRCRAENPVNKRFCECGQVLSLQGIGEVVRKDSELEDRLKRLEALIGGSKN